MSEPSTALLPAPSSYDNCTRSFALASQAAPLSRKQEMLIVSRLMNIALVRQDDLFFSFLNAHPDVPLTEASAIATKAQVKSFIERYTINEATHQKFMTDSLVVFETLKDWADKFDDEYQVLSGIGTILQIGTDFIEERMAQQARRMPNGVELAFYANPFLTLNVASEVYRDVMYDHYPETVTQQSMKTFNDYADKMHSYYKGKTPHCSKPEDRESALKNLKTVMGRIEKRMESRKNLEYAEDDIIGTALRALKDYIAPFMLPVERPPYAMKATENNLIPFPLSLHAQEERTNKEDRVVSVFHAQRQDPKPL